MLLIQRNSILISDGKTKEKLFVLSQSYFTKQAQSTLKDHLVEEHIFSLLASLSNTLSFSSEEMLPTLILQSINNYIICFT